jgi:hypothetical protein
MGRITGGTTPNGLPDRRRSVEGETFEGDRLRLSFDIARKLYRCPGCRGLIDVGAAHVYVHYLDADPPWDHEHWHSGCASQKLLRLMTERKEVSAPRAPKSRRRGRH